LYSNKILDAQNQKAPQLAGLFNGDFKTTLNNTTSVAGKKEEKESVVYLSYHVSSVYDS
jgi:hypothetical protein